MGMVIKYIAAILLLILLAACTTPTQQETKTILIGATLPLSGDQASLGEGAQNALNLVLAKRNNTKYNYKLIVEDDQFDATTASTTATKLIETDNVDAIVSLGSGIGNVVSPLAQNAKVIHFGIASDQNVAQGEYNFIHYTLPGEEARVWIEEAKKRRYNNIAAIVQQHAGVKAFMDDFKERLRSTTMTLVSEQEFQKGETNFNTMILKAKKSNPDVYFIAAFSPELELLYKQMKAQNIEEPISTSGTYETSEQMEMFEGEWYETAAIATDSFTNAYKEAYDKEPSFGAPNIYDSLDLIIEAFERTAAGKDKKPTAGQVIAHLHQIEDFDGALGTLSVSKTGQVRSNAIIREIKNGKSVTIG